MDGEGDFNLNLSPRNKRVLRPQGECVWQTFVVRKTFVLSRGVRPVSVIEIGQQVFHILPIRVFEVFPENMGGGGKPLHVGYCLARLSPSALTCARKSNTFIVVHVLVSIVHYGHHYGSFRDF